MSTTTSSLTAVGLVIGFNNLDIDNESPKCEVSYTELMKEMKENIKGEGSSGFLIYGDGTARDVQEPCTGESDGTCHGKQYLCVVLPTQTSNENKDYKTLEEFLKAVDEVKLHPDAETFIETMLKENPEITPNNRSLTHRERAAYCIRESLRCWKEPNKLAYSSMCNPPAEDSSQHKVLQEMIDDYIKQINEKLPNQ
ncbi:hypothetical protein COEREDRAFT_88353 [Coemansia reversa NRRL 1564]|uniref:Uncharacterized protein n=1 Tax=Coemansia reversa (strain ATCC 12441 / NRRL 1564) TaxID=763665 RepID=A0A2G5B723_COERN|nr:hypothetical protein COEREDRAFT_88353 [Coemansia reversa NRRL 1564]|eukprot:PIA14826.1 hypothetical protein COEREDRAFT_88353 [Coemansia reversa NRRL 1564]